MSLSDCLFSGDYFWPVITSIFVLLCYPLLLLNYKNNLAILNYLKTDSSVPYYFVIINAIFVAIIATLTMPEKRNKIYKIISMSTLLTIGSVVSLRLYHLTEKLPIVGNIFIRGLSFLETYLGPNWPRILIGWWGTSLSWATMLIPVAGPFISAILLIVPQQLLLLLASYMVLCFWA